MDLILVQNVEKKSFRHLVYHCVDSDNENFRVFLNHCLLYLQTVGEPKIRDWFYFLCTTVVLLCKFVSLLHSKYFYPPLLLIFFL